MKKLILIIFVFLSIMSFGQEKQTTCTNNDGSPCAEWVHKMIGQYPPKPYLPLPTREEAATFWTMRTFNEPVLRTNRQVFTSKTFIILNGIFATSVVVDVKYTHGVREHGDSEYPVIPAIIGLDYLADRFICRCLSVEAPIYGTVHYTLDMLK